MKIAPRSIVLIGFMGTGKSSVARELARRQGWPHFDTDEMVTEALEMPVAEIFARLGEERFRTEESAILTKLDPALRSVIAAGGGTILRPQNVKRLRQLGTTVCLTADLPTLLHRLADRSDRPLLPTENRAAKIEALLREREPLYEQAADLIIDTSSLTPDEIIEAIRKSLGLAG